MKAVVICLLLALPTTAALAQQPTTHRAYVPYQGRLVPLDSVKSLAGRRAKPGRYRAAPYAMRVRVPQPHPDSVAVASPGRSADRMPRPQQPTVQLVPEGTGRKVQ